MIFWVGIPGAVSHKQGKELETAGFPGLGEFREITGGYEGESKVLRTYAEVQADDEPSAAAKIAGVLEVEADELSVHPPGFFFN